MYFVTNEAILFNSETGIVINLQPVTDNTAPPYEVWEVVMGRKCLHMGSRWECEDFVYSIAGWVGAVNPLTLEKSQ